MMLREEPEKIIGRLLDPPVLRFGRERDGKEQLEKVRYKVAIVANMLTILVRSRRAAHGTC